MSYDVRRNSAGRADLLATLIPAGATVLDFGAHHGLMAQRLAEQGFRVTAVSPDLRDVPDVERVEGLLSPEQIVGLGRFDVTLALSVLHHCDPWRDYADALLEITDHALYVETPGPDEDVPQQPGLYEWASSFETVGTFPGFRDGHRRNITVVP